MLFFTRPKLEKKLIQAIEEIEVKNLVAATKSQIKDGKATLIIDLAILEVGKDQTKIIEEKIREKFLAKKIALKNILFTASQEIKSQTPEEKKPEPEKFALPGIKKIIAIASGKGGVGKSTLAVNIAISLKKIGYNVGLADADIYGPSIAHMMNLNQKPESEGNLIIPINSYGIYSISMGSLIDVNQALAWRGPMIVKALNQLIKGVKWPDIDYLIIDLPPGTGDVHLNIAQNFPITGAVIISTPGEVALIDAAKAIDMFKKVKVPILGIVENMSYLLNQDGSKSYIFGQDGAKNLAQKLNLNFLGQVPLEEKIRKSSDEKNPVTNQDPSCQTSFTYGQIAENIIDQINKR